MLDKKYPSLAQSQKQKSMMSLQNDKSILHPKKQMLKDNPQKFIKEFL